MLKGAERDPSVRPSTVLLRGVVTSKSPPIGNYCSVVVDIGRHSSVFRNYLFVSWRGPRYIMSTAVAHLCDTQR